MIVIHVAGKSIKCKAIPWATLPITHRPSYFQVDFQGQVSSSKLSYRVLFIIGGWL